MSPRLAIVRPVEPVEPRSYADYLRAKGIEPLPSPHTVKHPGDIVMTGTGSYTVGEGR